MSGEKIYEGVFAVHKPQGVSSADVLRTLQTHFNRSQLFRPWLESERERRQRESQFQRKRRRTQRLDVKIGHGGTLDPLATGVLVAGVGKGTKHLQDFLGCTKSYETVVLFGAETDTYDKLGKIVRRAPYAHVTRDAVEKALEQFRGKIMQSPPIFSALKVQGKKLYEYAREGKEPPVEIQARPVEVTELEIVEWYPPGTHQYTWPEEEMGGEERVVAEKMLETDAARPVATSTSVASAEESGSGRTTISTTTGQNVPAKRKTSPPPAPGEVTPTETTAAAENEPEPTAKKQKITHAADEESSSTNAAEATEAPPPSPPAVKLTMTVTSGFYVRSLAHDLGKALGSCGLMSSLIRTRQADFNLEPAENILEYRDLEAGEDVWGPKVKRFLEEWEKKRALAQAQAEAQKESE